MNNGGEREEERESKRRISTNLAHCSAAQRDDGTVAIANKNTSKWVAVARYCPAVCLERSRSHVFPSLDFPGLRWFPSTPGSDPVCLNRGIMTQTKPKNKFVCGWTLTGSSVCRSRRKPLDDDRRKQSNWDCRTMIETEQNVIANNERELYACDRLTYKRVRSQVGRAEAAAGARHIAQS